MNLEKSFYDIYLFININFFPQKVGRNFFYFEFHILSFLNLIEIYIYLFIYLSLKSLIIEKIK